MTRLNDLLIQASEKYGYPGYLDKQGIFRMRRGGYSHPVSITCALRPSGQNEREGAEV